jgi:hypothetical protein
LGRQIEPAGGAGVSKHRLKARAPRAAAGVSGFGGLLNFFSGNLTRRIILFVVIPLIFLSYFGTLTFAILWSQKTYDWRSSVISNLISPRNNPEFHTVPSVGIAITGLLIIPFAGYINRRLGAASRLGANIGTVALASGAIWLLLAGLIVSRSHHGTSSLPRLHEMCARTAALSMGTGLVAFCLCALKGYFIPAKRKIRYPRRLLISWVLLTLGPVLCIVFSEGLLLIVRAQLQWSYQIDQTLKNSLFWHLAFWEWIGSAGAFLFLLSSALFLPEERSKGKESTDERDGRVDEWTRPKRMNPRVKMAMRPKRSAGRRKEFPFDAVSAVDRLHDSILVEMRRPGRRLCCFDGT